MAVPFSYSVIKIKMMARERFCIERCFWEVKFLHFSRQKTACSVLLIISRETDFIVNFSVLYLDTELSAIRFSNR